MAKIARSNWKNLVPAVSAALLWGISGTCGQYLFQQQVETDWLVAVRLLLAGGGLLFISGMASTSSIWTIWKYAPDRSSLLLFSILGMLSIQYTYFAAIAHSNAATATVLQFSGPIFIALYLALRHRRWPSFPEMVALVFASLGTFLLVTHGHFDSLAISGKALFWGLASALALAFYSIQPARLLQKYPAEIIVGWAMVIGGGALSFLHPPWNITGIWNIYTLLALFVVILPGSLLAFYLYMTSVKKIGAQLTSLLVSIEPLSAACISVLWLNVTWSFSDWLGSIFIISTVFILTFQRKTPSSSEGEHPQT